MKFINHIISNVITGFHYGGDVTKIEEKITVKDNEGINFIAQFLS